MAKTSVRVEPVGKADVAGRGRHNSRTGRLAAHVDPLRTCFNTPLYGGDDAVEAIWQDIAGCDQARAGNGPVCAEMLSSFPLKLIGREKLTAAVAVECLASPIFQTWVDTTLEVMRRHGLIHADLHMDEETPHIQGFCSVKTDRKVGKRDRSNKSKVVLNYAAHWGVQGDKKTKDFCFAAGCVSHDPKRLAKVEEKYGMMYDPSATPMGKLQTEFAEAYKAAGLDLDRGESVLTTGKRHKTFYEHRAEEERKAVEAEIDSKNAERLAAYREQAEERLRSDKALIDAATKQVEEAKRKAQEEVAWAEAALEEAKAEARCIKERAMADVATVKAHYDALRGLGETLLGVRNVAEGAVEYLKQLREAADQQFRTAIWRGAQELRRAVRQAVETVEAQTKDEVYDEAEERLDLRM